VESRPSTARSSGVVEFDRDRSAAEFEPENDHDVDVSAKEGATTKRVDGMPQQPAVEGPQETRAARAEPAPKNSIALKAENQIVALATEGQPVWQRTESTEQVALGSQLHVLEASRPRLILDGKLELTIVGPATVASPKTSDGTWTFGAGRFGWANLGEEPSEVAGEFGGTRAQIRLRDPNTVMFAEVKILTPRGVDPMTAERKPDLSVWVAKGTAEVQLAVGEPHTILAGQKLQQAGDAEPAVLSEAAPAWANAAAIRPIERQGARLMEPLISSAEPLEDALTAAFADRRTDVRSLAARGLASIGIYKPLVQTFSDPRFHAYWESHYRSLRQAIQMDPEQAKQIRAAIQDSDRVSGDTLYRILWGFDAEQLGKEAAAKLVNSLESASLPVRVFSVEALREITGTDARYRPDYHSNRRKDALLGWQRRLQNGEIVHSPRGEFGT
jgi:hypothetical protein